MHIHMHRIFSNVHLKVLSGELVCLIKLYIFTQTFISRNNTFALEYYTIVAEVVHHNLGGVNIVLVIVELGSNLIIVSF
jgi:hypothetical protein